MTTGSRAQQAAASAAEAIRLLNHQTRPGAAQNAGLDVTDIYDILASLALLAARLPQTLRQVEDLLDVLVEDHQVDIVDGDPANDLVGDPVAAAAVVGHWLSRGRVAADQFAHGLDAAQQTLAFAARASS